MKNIFLILILFVLSISTGCQPEPPERQFVITLSENIKNSNEWEYISKVGDKFETYKNNKRKIIISLYISKNSYENHIVYIRSINDRNISMTFLSPSTEFNILSESISNKRKMDSLNKLSKEFYTDSVTTSKGQP